MVDGAADDLAACGEVGAQSGGEVAEELGCAGANDELGGVAVDVGGGGGYASVVGGCRPLANGV